MSDDQNKKSIEDMIKEVKRQQEEFSKLDHGKIMADAHAALQKCMFYFGEDQHFLGPMVQELNYSFSYGLPTAGIGFDKNQGQFTVAINPLFFLQLSEEERVAVMHHESLHFLNNHLLRFPWTKDTPKDKKQLENIAMDMAINCYIKNTPKGGVKVEDWKLHAVDIEADRLMTVNGHEFEEEEALQVSSTLKLPKGLSTKKYYARNITANSLQLSETPKGKIVDITSIEDGEVTLKSSKQNSTKSVTVQHGKPFPKFKTAEEYIELIKQNAEANQDKQQKYGKNGEGAMDSHEWEELSESDKQKYLEELKDVLQRTITKTHLDKNKMPGVWDLIKEIEVQLTKINEKAILALANKKTFCAHDRTSTWKKKNKRYGFQAPGTKIGNLPKLNIYQDTSGSRSHFELNMDREIIERFLRAGAKECNLILWHSKIYKKKKYKLFQKVNANEIESGGTDLNEVIDDINKTMPDLSLIITDGEYHLDTGKVPKGQTIFLIVDNGRMEHQLKSVCKTIQIKNLKG